MYYFVRHFKEVKIMNGNIIDQKSTQQSNQAGEIKNRVNRFMDGFINMNLFDSKKVIEIPNEANLIQEESNTTKEDKEHRYKKIKNQLHEIGLLVDKINQNNDIKGKFNTLNKAFNIEKNLTKRHLFQFYESLKTYSRSEFYHEGTFPLMPFIEIAELQGTGDADRKLKYKVWKRLVISFEKLVKILIQDLEADKVRIYYWKPTEIGSTGHVSLQTKEIYASFWPEEQPEIKTGYSSNGNLHDYIDDVATYAKDAKRETGKEDQRIEISGLNTSEINRRFLEFKNQLEETKSIRWSLLSHRLLDKCYPNIQRQNCSGLVAELLEAGDIKKLASGFAYRNSSFFSTFFRYLYTKELGPLFMTFSSITLEINGLPNLFTFIYAGMLCGFPLFGIYLFLNFRKRHHLLEFNTNIIGNLVAIIVDGSAVGGPLLMVNLMSNKLGQNNLSLFSLLGIAYWTTVLWYRGSDKLIKFVDFLIRCCCRGTDVLIQPRGVVKLAQYVDKIGLVTNRLKSRIDQECTSAYLIKSFASSLGAWIGSYTSNQNFVGVNQGGLIGLHVGMLLATALDVRSKNAVRKLYTERFLSYDPMNDTHWPESKNSIDDQFFRKESEPDFEIARNDFEYLDEAFKDVLYTPGFSTTVIFGVSWGILLSSHYFDNNLTYFPWIVAGGGIGGFLTAALVYHLAIKVVKTCKKTGITEGTIAIDEKSAPLLDVQIGNNSLSFFNTQLKEDKYEYQEDKLLVEQQRQTRCYCAIL